MKPKLILLAITGVLIMSTADHGYSQKRIFNNPSGATTLGTGEKIQMKRTDISSATDAICAPFYIKRTFETKLDLYKEIICDYFEVEPKNEPLINKIQNELIIMDVALNYILFIDRYEHHPKIDEIINVANSKISKFILDMWGSDNYNESLSYFKMRVRQFLKAFNQDNPIKTLAKMMQFIIEKKIYFDNIPDYNKGNESEALYMIAEHWAMPVIQHFIPCQVYIGNAIPAIKEVFNRWEIE